MQHLNSSLGRKISVKMKEKIYQRVVRPALLNRMEAIPQTKTREAELEVAELKLSRFDLECRGWRESEPMYQRCATCVRWVGEKAGEARLRWLRHVQRRDAEYVRRRRMLRSDLPGRRERMPWRRRTCERLEQERQETGQRRSALATSNRDKSNDDLDSSLESH